MRSDGSLSAASDRTRERVTLLILCVLAAAVLIPYRHFAGDDAYISFRFAQNVATGHGFAFNPDQPTYGSTSPLWVDLMAVLHQVGLPIVDAAHLLDAVGVLLLILVFWRLTVSCIGSHWMRALATLLLVLDPWFVHWAMSGMENVLALLLLCTAMLAQQRQRGKPGIHPLAPICCGLGVLTRPEFAVFSVLLVADTFLFESSARIKKSAAYALIIGAVVAPWFLYAWVHFGSVVPNTISAKISANRGASLVGTLKYFGSFFVFEAAGLGLVVAFGFARVKAALSNRSVVSRWFLPTAWMLALPAFYVVGGAPVAGRYLLLGLPACLLVGVKGWELLLELRPRMPWVRAATVGCAALSLALVVAVQAKYVWYVTAWPEGMDPRALDLARWLQANSAPGDLIAADQIGVVGYVSERSILDLAGLVSPEMQRPRRSGEKAIWEAVRKASPQWIIALDDKAHLASVVPDLESLELVGVYDIQREGAQSVGARFAYKLFRTAWPRKGAVLSAAAATQKEQAEPTLQQ